jgi:type VI secretion system protein ImpM
MVLPFKRAEPEAVAGYSLYGKLPNRDDFVRINAHHPAIVEFDNLVQRTLERLSMRDDWAETYDRLGPASFQMVSGDSRHTLVGVLAPSRDRAGRRYPFLAAAIVPTDVLASHASVTPIAHEVFFDGLRVQVGNAIENSVEALSCRQFLESQLHVNNPAAADLALAAGVVDRFMVMTPVARLRELLEDEGRGVQLEQALLNIAFYRAFLRRFDSVATNQIIVLPLPQSHGEQALAASAWLSVISALSGSKSDGEDWRGNYTILQVAPEKVAILSCFNKIHDKFAITMLAGAQDRTMILDLRDEHEAWKNHRLYAEVSYALGRTLGDPGLSIRDLCRFLEEVGRKLKETI